MKRRVGITGVGMITAVGSDQNSFWQGILSGKSGVDYLSLFDTTDLEVKIGAEVKNFDPGMFLERKEIRKTDRFVHFAVAGAKTALEDSGFEINQSNAHNIGVIIGSGIGGIKTFEDQARILVEKGPKRISPFFIPMIIPDMSSGYVSIATGAKGPNHTAVSACASAAHAISHSLKLIQDGDVDLMITGGAEAAMTKIAYAGFSSAGALSNKNEAPQQASRPFDLNRDGFVMGEGSGILILEELEHARQRGAQIYAELVSCGETGDAYHMTAPDPEGQGAAMAMQKVIANAGIAPAQISYINAHGTSTPPNDRIETLAIKQVFGDRAYQIPISSTKSMTGHLLGAAAGVEAIITALTLKEGIIPPTINYETPDPDCDLDYVPGKARRVGTPLEYAISNSFGFGGHNISILFKRYDENN